MLSIETIKILQEFAKNDPMKCEIIDHNETDFDAALERHAKEGRRLAAMSNAGLPVGKCRLTFLPESVFLKPGEEQEPAQEPRDVQEIIKEIGG